MQVLAKNMAASEKHLTRFSLSETSVYNYSVIMHSNNRGRCLGSVAKARRKSYTSIIQKTSDLNSNISRCRKFVDVAQSFRIIAFCR